MPKEPTTAKTRRPTVRRRKAAAAPVVTHDQIAERAYLLYVGGVEGDAFTHWVRAERELTAA
jgi:ABC-type sugar transport system substrate-binding protein